MIRIFLRKKNLNIKNFIKAVYKKKLFFIDLKDYINIIKKKKSRNILKVKIINIYKKMIIEEIQFKKNEPIHITLKKKKKYNKIKIPVEINNKKTYYYKKFLKIITMKKIRKINILSKKKKIFLNDIKNKNIKFENFDIQINPIILRTN